MQTQLAAFGHSTMRCSWTNNHIQRLATPRPAQSCKQATHNGHVFAACRPHRYRVQATNGAASDNSTEVSLDEADQESNEVDLEEKMQEFLRQQALVESGESYVAPQAAASESVLGAEAVTDEDAKVYCTEVRDRIKLLKSNRDMTFNEIKLTISIEDPRARERRENLGIEDDSGVSRDELAAALQEVAEGRIPRKRMAPRELAWEDRIALRELAREMLSWPYADLSNDSRLQEKAARAEPEENEEGILRPKKLLGRDKNEKPEGLADLLPDWVGYGALYALSATPIVIGLVVVTVLFLNSLK